MSDTAMAILDPTMGVDEFEYVQLSEIDPSFKAIEASFYNLQVLKSEFKDFTYKNGPKTGSKGRFIKFTLAVIDDEKYNGRRIFAAPLHANGYTFRAMRKLMDATGVQQEPGMPLDAWLVILTEQKPTFRCFVTQVPGFKDPTTMDNDLDWKQLQPAA